MSNLLEKAKSDLELKELKNEELVIISEAESYIIENQDAVSVVIEFMSRIKTKIKTVKDKLNPMVKDAHSLHKKLTTMRNELTLPFETALKISTEKINIWNIKQAEIQKREQDRLNAIARKAEEKRIKELEAQAKRHEDKGNIDKADERRELIEDVYIPVEVADNLQKSVKTESGNASMIEDIEITVTDEMEVLKAIINRRLPLSAIEVKYNVIKKHCKNMGIKNGEILGIRINKKFITRIKTKSNCPF